MREWIFRTPHSTFVDTTVFAAGFATDMRIKKDRKEKRAISFHHPGGVLNRLREESISDEELDLLQQLHQMHALADRDTTDNTQELHAVYYWKMIPEDVDWDEVAKVAGMDLTEEPTPVVRHVDPDSLAISDTLWDLLAPDPADGPLVFEWSPSTGLDPGKRYNLPPQSLWALDIVRTRSMRNRSSPKKLAIQEVSVCVLIHQLLALSDAHLAPDSALAPLSPHISEVALLTSDEFDRSVQKIKETIDLFERTKVEDWPMDPMTIRQSPKFIAEPYYMQDDDGDYHHIAHQLNLAIWNIFTEYQDKVANLDAHPDDLAIATAKICHNLLVSSAAPNLNTINILFTGFQRWKKPHLVDPVIDALEDCKIRPNETTCVAILEHYVDTERPYSFSEFIARMRGAQNALMLARPDITINEASEGRLIRLSENKVLQKVYPTSLVFKAIMRGVLKFAGFDRAMEIYYEMKEDGWGLDITGLSEFLYDCMHRADWQGGLAVWGEIASIQGRIEPTLLAKAYAQLLTLCSVAQKPAEYNIILNDVYKRGFDGKDILNSVKKFTHAVHRKGGRYVAPAKASDNVLSAVKDLIDEVTEAEAAPFQCVEEINADSDTEILDPQEDTDANQVNDWDIWLAHELGEPFPTKTASSDKGEAMLGSKNR